jgi:hypothetical protein
MKLPILTGAAHRKLTPFQAKFILDCLTLDRQLRAAAGFKRRRRGLHQELADKFGVSRWTIMDISRRRNWRNLRVSHLFDISEAHRSRTRNRNA